MTKMMTVEEMLNHMRLVYEALDELCREIACLNLSPDNLRFKREVVYLIYKAQRELKQWRQAGATPDGRNQVEERFGYLLTLIQNYLTDYTEEMVERAEYATVRNILNFFYQELDHYRKSNR